MFLQSKIADTLAKDRSKINKIIPKGLLAEYNDRAKPTSRRIFQTLYFYFIRSII